MSKELAFILEDRKLYIEKNIVIINIPLFFTCVDDDDQKYLVLCFDDENLKYLIAKTTNVDLIKMLNSETNLREPFKNSIKLWIVESGFDIKDDKVQPIKYHCIPTEFLPKKGAFLDLKNSSIEEYIKELENEIGIIREDIIILRDQYMLFQLISKTTTSKIFKEKICSCFFSEKEYSPFFQRSTKLTV